MKIKFIILDAYEKYGNMKIYINQIKAAIMAVFFNKNL